MGDILDVINTRKSIRRYKDDPIPDEVLDKVLEAARWAPSGENEQPWKIIVVRDPETRRNIGEIAKVGSGQWVTAQYCLGKLQPRFAGIKDPETRDRVMKFMYTGEVSQFPAKAPVVLIIAGEIKDMIDTPYDLCACAENILLEAHSLGLGGCWVHGPVASPRAVNKIKGLVGMPTGIGEYKVIAIISLGWPLEERKHPRPKKPLEDIVYWERFGNRERA